MKIRFSILIPVYNVATYLDQCLQSVLDQSFVDFEVICINDGSTDSSADILAHAASVDHRIKIYTQANSGLSAARNAGIEQASGEYLLFLDGDDWLETDALQVLSEALSGEEVLCFSGRRYFEESGIVEKPDLLKAAHYSSGWEYFCEQALEKRKFHFMCVVQRIYKRTFLLKHKLQFKTGIVHEDHLFTPQVLYFASKLTVINSCHYNYRIRNGSITSTNNPRQLYDLVTVANTLAEFFLPLQEIDKKTIYREIAGEYFKGFLREEQDRTGVDDATLSQLINWDFFRLVSVYPRHLRIYWLLRINPKLFRIYIRVETCIKEVKCFQ